MSLLKSAGTVSALTLVSRLLGYIRDVFIASILGAGVLADAFLVAYRLPNFFRQISAEGALNNAFVPLFSGKLQSEGKEKASIFASHVLGWLLILLLGLTILMIVYMPHVMGMLAYGFRDSPEKMRLAIDFGRIVFPYVVLISVVSLLAGILQSLGKFTVAACAPIILNICMVLAITLGGYVIGKPAHALCVGVIIAGILQVIWVWRAVRICGVHLRMEWPHRTGEMRILFRRMIPGIIGGGVTQLNVWVNTIVATTVPGVVSYLYYADRIVQFPLALVGTALGVVLLPHLSRAFKENQLEEAINVQNRALALALLLTIPAALGLYMVSDYLIAALFKRGVFGSAETYATYHVLQIYALGLPAFVMIKIFLPGYFAVGDTKTPLKIALICLVVNIVLSVSLVGSLSYRGLASATTVTAWMNAILLWQGLVRSGRYRFDAELKQAMKHISSASVSMVVVIKLLEVFIPGYIEQLVAPHSSYYHALMLTCLVVLGGGVFLLMSYRSGALAILKKF